MKKEIRIAVIFREKGKEKSPPETGGDEKILLQDLCFSEIIHRDYDDAEVRKVLSLLRQSGSAQEQHILFPGRNCTPLPVSSILYVSSDAHYCLVHFQASEQTGKKKGTVLRIRLRSKDLESLLPSPPFVHCNRGLFVNMDHVSAYRADALVLTDGTCCPVRRRGRREVLQYFLAYKRRGVRSPL